jgi:bacteriophage exclusion system BrxA-like protein
MVGSSHAFSLQTDADRVIYTATITSASLRLRESRIIADLLLQAVTDTAWKEAIVERNVLQMGSVESIKRISLDLDDGVKVNYGKFGHLLAEVKLKFPTE